MCYVRIDTFQGRKKIQAKSTKQYLGIFKELFLHFPITPTPVLVIWESPGERKSQLFFHLKASESKKYLAIIE